VGSRRAPIISVRRIFTQLRQVCTADGPRAMYNLVPVFEALKILEDAAI